MTWFFAVVIVAVMGGVAVVASGRGGEMADAFDDRPDARVPADGPLSADDVRRVRFSTAFRGYRMSEVDALLDRLAAELEPRATTAPAPPLTSTDSGEPAGEPAGQPAEQPAEQPVKQAVEQAGEQTGVGPGVERGVERASHRRSSEHTHKRHG